MKKKSASNNSGGRKRSPLLFGITFRAILTVAAAAMFLSYASVYINPSKFSFPLFFGLYFIPLLGINLLLLIIALLRRSASAWITIVALLPSLLYSELFVKIASPEKIETVEGAPLKIESYNIGMFSSADGKLTRDECRKEFAAHLREHNPQIVCLQEFFAESRTQADTIFGQYPYRHYHLFKVRNGKLFGNIILSMLPIEEKGRLSFPNSTNLSIFADVEHAGETVRIYNNHLESYNVSFMALVNKFSSGKAISGDELKRDIVDTHEKMKGTFIKRSEQVGQILNNINSTSHRSIICGDFNDTPMSYTYHTLAKRRKDTFEESGTGFGGTFRPMWPLLRIDYVLAPQDATCTSHTIHKIKLSDHYPTIAEIVVPPLQKD